MLLAWLLTLCLVLGGLLPLLHPVLAYAAGALPSIPSMPLCTSTASAAPTYSKEKQQSPQDQKNVMRDCARSCGSGLPDLPALPAGFKWLGSRPTRFYAAAPPAGVMPALRLYADAQPRAPPSDR